MAVSVIACLPKSPNHRDVYGLQLDSGNVDLEKLINPLSMYGLFAVHIHTYSLTHPGMIHPTDWLYPGGVQVRRWLTDGRSSTSVAEDLCRVAVKLGSHDNVSAVVLKFSARPLARAASSSRLRRAASEAQL